VLIVLIQIIVECLFTHSRIHRIRVFYFPGIFRCIPSEDLANINQIGPMVARLSLQQEVRVQVLMDKLDSVSLRFASFGPGTINDFGVVHLLGLHFLCSLSSPPSLGRWPPANHMSSFDFSEQTNMALTH